jgi:UDP-N-acetylmuramoylalanine--D-glutamate ligase
LVVNEIPSFQLERFQHAPEIALITNIFNDHLNRHGTMENYARTKAAIFTHQNEHEKLILNADNEWSEFFLNLEPKSELWFFSIRKLPEDMMGVYYSDGALFLRTDKDDTKIFNAKAFIERWGMHNLENLSAAILAAYLSGESMPAIRKRIPTLPQIKFREESIYRSKHLEIINDTAATSPEGGIAALERFAGPETILIAGGTDASLDYKLWAKKVLETIQPSHVILLSGSATEKMLRELKNSSIAVRDTLETCLTEALEKAKAMKKGKKATVLFSPAAKSFEKFKNEFDRGEQFNAIVSKLKRRLP